MSQSNVLVYDPAEQKLAVVPSDEFAKKTKGQNVNYETLRIPPSARKLTVYTELDNEAKTGGDKKGGLKQGRSRLAVSEQKETLRNVNILGTISMDSLPRQKSWNPFTKSAGNNPSELKVGPMIDMTRK